MHSSFSVDQDVAVASTNSCRCSSLVSGAIETSAIHQQD